MTSRLVGVIDANGDRLAAGRSDHRRGLIDRFWPAIRRRLSLHAATGAVDGRTGGAQRTGDAAPGPARGAGDEHDAVPPAASEAISSASLWDDLRFRTEVR